VRKGRAVLLVTLRSMLWMAVVYEHIDGKAVFSPGYPCLQHTVWLNETMHKTRQCSIHHEHVIRVILARGIQGGVVEGHFALHLLRNIRLYEAGEIDNVAMTVIADDADFQGSNSIAWSCIGRYPFPRGPIEQIPFVRYGCRGNAVGDIQPTDCCHTEHGGYRCRWHTAELTLEHKEHHRAQYRCPSQPVRSRPALEGCNTRNSSSHPRPSRRQNA